MTVISPSETTGGMCVILVGVIPWKFNDPGPRLWKVALSVGSCGALAAGFAGLLPGLVVLVGLAVAAVAVFVETRLLARRMPDVAPLARLGKARFVGQRAVVTRAIPSGWSGRVKIGRHWCDAWTEQDDADIPEGTTVVLTAVRDFRLFVRPVGAGDD